MLFSTFITYLSGLLISRHQSRVGLKRLWVFLSFAINISILIFFKYFDFFADNVVRVFALFNVEVVAPTFDVLLPVGISFYTFQALSYTMDVYRGELKAERNFITYALFVSFFPQLVAGPIERSVNLLPQFKKEHKFDYERMHHGFVLMIWGLFQKMVVADRISIVVDKIYASPGDYRGSAIVFATLLFAFQIYCDFGGYSNIAVGTAEIMGFDLMKNFQQPYLSTSVRMFWRRWHISLNKWFTDYLYIPMGGSRCKTPRKIFNRMVTFGLSGLWHGASWGFVVWGLLNGIYITIEEGLQALRERLTHIPEPGKIAGKIIAVLKTVLTFAAIDFSWLFFRARTLENAHTALSRIFLNFDLSGFLSDFRSVLYGVRQFDLNFLNYYVLAVGILAVVIVDVAGSKGFSVSKLTRLKLPLRWILYLTCLTAILIYGEYGFEYSAESFIYFQF